MKIDIFKAALIIVIGTVAGVRGVQSAVGGSNDRGNIIERMARGNGGGATLVSSTETQS
jgi:hypothetical protein